MPADAVPAKGTDKQLTVYQPSTDRLWEFWQASKVDGRWQACWGGRLDHASTSPGYFPGGFGSSASGLAISGGMVRVDDVEAGRIDHALALQIISPRSYQEFSWPAQRSDGWSDDPDAVPEGLRLRLDPSVDVASLGLEPVTEMIALAAQKYGFIVVDKAGAVAVTGETGTATQGTNPWPGFLRGVPDHSVLKGFRGRTCRPCPSTTAGPDPERPRLSSRGLRTRGRRARAAGPTPARPPAVGRLPAPLDDPGGVPGHDGPRRHVGDDHGSRADDAPGADAPARQDDAPGADPHVVLDDDRTVVPEALGVHGDVDAAGVVRGGRSTQRGPIMTSAPMCTGPMTRASIPMSERSPTRMPLPDPNHAPCSMFTARPHSSSIQRALSARAWGLDPRQGGATMAGGGSGRGRPWPRRVVATVRCSRQSPSGRAKEDATSRP